MAIFGSNLRIWPQAFSIIAVKQALPKHGTYKNIFYPMHHHISVTWNSEAYNCQCSCSYKCAVLNISVSKNHLKNLRWTVHYRTKQNANILVLLPTRWIDQLYDWWLCDFGWGYVLQGRSCLWEGAAQSCFMSALENRYESALWTMSGAHRWWNESLYPLTWASDLWRDPQATLPMVNGLKIISYTTKS